MGIKRGNAIRMYPFMTFNDDTEITHSEMKPDGKVKVYIETPDAKYYFKHATCWLLEYKWEDIFQYSEDEIHHFDEIIHSMAHLIMEFSQEGGFDNSRIPNHTLRNIMRMIEARHNDVIQAWLKYFGEIRYFC